MNEDRWDRCGKEDTILSEMKVLGDFLERLYL